MILSTSPFVKQDQKKHLLPANFRRVLVYESLNLAYNRVKKSANSSVCMFIADAVRGGGGDSASGSFDAYSKNKRAALSKGSVLSAIDFIRPARRKLSFMTVVRNPYSRLLSAFLQKRHLLLERGKKSLARFPGFTHPDEQKGFSDFVDYIGKSGPFGNKHWAPQKSLLIMPPEHFDYVLKVENLDEGLNQMFADLRPDWTTRSYRSPHPGELGPKITNASQKVDDYYSRSMKSIVFEVYREDFESFHYSAA